MDGKKLLLGCAALVGLLVVVSCAGFLFFVQSGPNTWVETGNQLDQKHLKTIQDLGLLEQGEVLEFFYSDALSDITEGMYLLTDRQLIIHMSEADPQTTRVQFKNIEDISTSWSESWLDDSQIVLFLFSGEVIGFPLSSENEGDHQFMKQLEKKREPFKQAGPMVQPEETTKENLDESETGLLPSP